MDKEFDQTVLKLKNVLKQKYGNDFKKFYLVNLGTDDWGCLVTSKVKEDENPGTYYSVKDDSLVLDD